jgi:predicted  nucleic acid-binding Zn-ribbon protein
MTDNESVDSDERLAELLRVNRELAGEVRALREGRTTEPRPSQLPAARHVAALRRERDSLEQQLEAARAELHEGRQEREALRGRIRGLEQEVARLRGGLSGLLRRARARLLGS